MFNIKVNGVLIKVPTLTFQVTSSKIDAANSVMEVLGQAMAGTPATILFRAFDGQSPKNPVLYDPKFGPADISVTVRPPRLSASGRTPGCRTPPPAP